MIISVLVSGLPWLARARTTSASLTLAVATQMFGTKSLRQILSLMSANGCL